MRGKVSRWLDFGDLTVGIGFTSDNACHDTKLDRKLPENAVAMLWAPRYAYVQSRHPEIPHLNSMQSYIHSTPVPSPPVAKHASLASLCIATTRQHHDRIRTSGGTPAKSLHVRAISLERSPARRQVRPVLGQLPTPLARLQQRVLRRWLVDQI